MNSAGEPGQPGQPGVPHVLLAIGIERLQRDLIIPKILSRDFYDHKEFE